VGAMPDQSSASTEHALMQEITAPLSTLPDDPLPEVADVDFPLVLRGYDRDSVDAYVARTSRLVAELQTIRTPEAAVRRALERVGEEVSGILQRAHDTASRVTAQSRSEAEDRLEAARQEAAEIVRSAEERLRELDAETDRIWAERQRIVEDTRELARELLTLTDSAADRFPPDQPAAEAALPGVEAVPPGFENEAPEFEGEAREFEGEAREFEVGAGEAEPDTEPTAILPVVEPAEADVESPPPGVQPPPGPEAGEPGAHEHDE
jgi:DivIVA domain-containing protein